MERLFESKISFDRAASKGYVFTPFIPQIGTVCTLINTKRGGYIFEEVEVKDVSGKECSFNKTYWRELTDLPDIEEVMSSVEEHEFAF